ncbi:MAG TPA: transcription elongation factor GreA [Candidatus Paceibacterota bacterium]
MTYEKEYLTKEKHEELLKELDHLKKTKRREVADSLEYAKSMGDISENQEYQEARDMQASVEERIGKIENILKHAEIVGAHRGGVITIGSTIVVKKTGDADTKIYQVVGSEEADIIAGKISNHSPIGVAVMGKKKGDRFDLQTPKGKAAYEIVNVK